MGTQKLHGKRKRPTVLPMGRRLNKRKVAPIWAEDDPGIMGNIREQIANGQSVVSSVREFAMSS